MSKPLKPAEPRPRQTRPANQNEMMDELARKIADENDIRARQRYDEVVNPQKYYSAEKKRAMNIGIWICLMVIIAIVVFALNSHN